MKQEDLSLLPHRPSLLNIKYVAIIITLTLVSCSTTHEPETHKPPETKDITLPIKTEPENPILKPVPSLPVTPLSINTIVKNFVQHMVIKYHFNEYELTQILQSAVIKDSILKQISSPSEGLPWHKYRKIFMTESRIEGGVKFWHENAEALKQVSEQTGVSSEIIVAIIGVETGYGKNMGNHRVLDALVTLAFAYPPRSSFFMGELENFLLLCREEHKDSREPLGSYAGAMGYPQFMPSSFRALAKDYEQDGQRDIWHNPRDAIASIGNYFAKNGWQQGERVVIRAEALGYQYKNFLNTDLKPTTTLAQLEKAHIKVSETLSADTHVKVVALQQLEGEELWLGFHNFYVITRYNHSPLYAMVVYQLSQEIHSVFASSKR